MHSGITGITGIIGTTGIIGIIGIGITGIGIIGVIGAIGISASAAGRMSAFESQARLRSPPAEYGTGSRRQIFAGDRQRPRQRACPPEESCPGRGSGRVKNEIARASNRLPPSSLC
jgi:hypothetical protein